jgi:hypothetical protein
VVSWVEVSCWTCDFEMAKSNGQVNGQVNGPRGCWDISEWLRKTTVGPLTLPGHSFGLEILT